MSSSVKSIVVLSAIALILAILLAGVNYFTAAEIAKAEEIKTKEALKEVYPSEADFTQLNLADYEGVPSTVTDVYSFSDGGFVVKLKTAGYGSGMVLICGVDKEGAVTGAKCLASTETLGEEKTYGEKLVGAELDTIDLVDTVSGATKTTAAYRNAIKDAIGVTVLISGGSYDNRSEEEKKLDEALPGAEGSFEGVFYAERLDGVTKVFKAQNGAGYVFVFGDAYIGCDNQGNVLTGTQYEHASDVPAYLTAINSTQTESVSFTEGSLPEEVTAVFKTASGNYIFELSAKGFKSLKGGAPIVIKVSIDGNGSIISCITVSQNESQNYGAPCGDPSYYMQYNGKTSSDCTEVDAISGATVTSNAYLGAIQSAFEAYNTLKGEPVT